MFQTAKYPEGESSTPSSSPQWLQSIPLLADDYTNYTGRGVILPNKKTLVNTAHCHLKPCFFFPGGCPAKAVKGNCNKTRPLGSPAFQALRHIFKEIDHDKSSHATSHHFLAVHCTDP